MKNILSILVLAFLVACGGEEEKSIEALIQEGNLEEIKAKQADLKSQEKELKAKYIQLSEYIEKQDTAKRLPLVTVYPIQTEKFNHFIELQGNVETDQNIVVYPEYTGTLLDFKVNMGDRVSKGQVVATIDDGGIGQQLSQMEQVAKLSKITYEKRKRLWDQKIGSEMDYLASETQYLADQNMVNQMQAQVAKATVRAPFTGIIDETIADEGQLVSPGQTPLFRIVNLSKMNIKVDVPEKYLSKIKEGSMVKIELPILDTIITSRVVKASNYINPANRTFKVEVEVPNTDGKIKPNLTARLKITDYKNEKSILIPQSVISEDSEGRQYVYRADISIAGNSATAIKVFIVTGLKQDGKIEILEGLFPESEIIQEGARTVKDGQEVQIIK